MARKTSDNPVSLFAFQDIITAVMGIILLLVLLLSLCLVQLPDTESPKTSGQSTEELETQLKSLQEELDQITKSAEQSDIILFSESELQQRIKEAQLAQESIDLLMKKAEADLNEVKEERKEVADQVAASASKKQKVSELEELLKKKQEELEKIKSGNRRFYNFSENNTSLPWIVDLQSDKILVAKAQSKMKPVVFRQAGKQWQSVNEWIRENGHESDYFLFILREKRIDDFAKIRDFVDAFDADIGVELVGASVKVLDE